MLANHRGNHPERLKLKRTASQYTQPIGQVRDKRLGSYQAAIVPRRNHIYSNLPMYTGDLVLC